MALVALSRSRSFSVGRNPHDHVFLILHKIGILKLTHFDFHDILNQIVHLGFVPLNFADIDDLVRLQVLKELSEIFLDQVISDDVFALVKRVVSKLDVLGKLTN